MNKSHWLSRIIDKKIDGFTMIELLVATAVVIMVLSGIASGVSFSIRNTTFSKEKSLSAKYAQESMEWLRNQRDRLGWNAFYQVISADGVEYSYCLDVLPNTNEGFVELSAVVNDEVNESNCDPITDTQFYRGVHLQIVSDKQINVVTTVGWYNGSDYRTTVLKSELRKW